MSGALAGLAPGGGEALLSTSKSATVSLELPAKEAIVARPAAGVGVVAAQRGVISARPRRRQRGVGLFAVRGAWGRPRGDAALATALSGTRSVRFVSGPRGSRNAPARASRIVSSVGSGVTTPLRASRGVGPSGKVGKSHRLPSVFTCR